MFLFIQRRCNISNNHFIIIKFATTIGSLSNQLLQASLANHFGKNNSHLQDDLPAGGDCYYSYCCLTPRKTYEKSFPVRNVAAADIKPRNEMNLGPV